MESPDRVIVESRDDTRFATARHVRRPSRGPDVYTERASEHVDLSFASQAAALRDTQRPFVVEIDHRNHAAQAELVACIGEHALRGFGCIAVAPVGRIEGVAQLLLLKYSESSRRLRAAEPAATNCQRGWLGLQNQVAQAAATEQRTVRLA